MSAPVSPQTPPTVARPRECWACHHPFGVVAKGGPALPGDVQSGTRWGALTSTQPMAGSRHTPCTPAATQSKSKAELKQ